MPKFRLFDCDGGGEGAEGARGLSEAQVRCYLDEGRLFRAVHAKETGNYAEAIQIFEMIHSADASFQAALVSPGFVT